jgi:FkbM family methyltransferase
VEPRDVGRTGALLKRAAPKLGRIIAKYAWATEVFRLSVVYAEILQGRGAGTGWDISAEARVAAQLVGPVHNPKIIDAGAHKGKWSLAMNDIFPQAQFILIEPHSSLRSRLEALRIGSSSSVLTAAVSDSLGTIELLSTDDESPSASIFARRDTYFSDVNTAQVVESVKKITIDAIVEDQEIRWIDFLKIDVEGAELLVLKGAIQTLQSKNVGALSFEFGAANLNSRVIFRDFWDFLDGLNYQIGRIVPGGSIIWINSYSEEHEYFRGVTNYVARLRVSNG